MRIEEENDEIRLTLNQKEVSLLRRALERASFLDTPASEQPEIASFSTSLLEALPFPSR